MSDSLKSTISFIGVSTINNSLFIRCRKLLDTVFISIGLQVTFLLLGLLQGRIFLYILKNILYTLKLLGQFLWWLIPIFPDRYRRPNGFTPYGAWDSQDNLSKTIPILSLITFITISILIFQYGVPSTVAAYSNVINIIVASGLIISILGLFFVF